MNHRYIIGVTSHMHKSPFFEIAVRASAKGVTVYNHILMPTYYETPEAGYWKLMMNVTIWDSASRCLCGLEQTGGFELYLRDGRYGAELWNRVMAAGAPWQIAPASLPHLSESRGAYSPMAAT
ncbi:MAG: hypothetical protein R3E79_03010 [Caldilineaceae bacterium]